MRFTCLIAAVLCLAACATPPEEPAETETTAPAGLENGSFDTDLDGFRIHYEVHGRGPVVMTVPNSWGLTLDGLRVLYRPLEEHLTMVYFDPRGMGGSGDVREDGDMSMAAVRTDFDRLRRHLGLEKVHALGWSNGAINLIHLAAEKPEILETAMFLHGNSKFAAEEQQRIVEEYPELTRGFGEFTQETHAAVAAGAGKDELDARMKTFILEGWFPHLFADPAAGRETLQEIYRDTGFSWHHNQYSNSEFGSGFDLGELLPSIPVRSLVMAGAHDMVPPESVRLLHDGLADSHFVVFEESAHYAPIEEPEAFRATILDFLGIEPGA
ncbi:MAG: alpha/beta hydrolase [Thermoanaerobaculia bacterium]